MGDIRIISGVKGKSPVEINADFQMETNASVVDRAAYISEAKGDSFRVVAPSMDITTGEKLVYWFTNTSATQHFHVERFFVSFNGGDTTGIKCVLANLKGGVPEPSANNSAATVIPLNSTKPKTGPLTGYYWDGVGSGMTVASSGQLAGSVHFDKGLTPVEPRGSIIVGTNGSFGVYVNPEEAGKFAIFVEGYFEDNE